MSAPCPDRVVYQTLRISATSQTEEGNEGRQAYMDKRPPDFGKFPRYP